MTETDDHPHIALVPDITPLHPGVEGLFGKAAEFLAGGRAIVIGYTADGELYCDSTITSGPQTVFALEWAKSLAMRAAIEDV